MNRSGVSTTRFELRLFPELLTDMLDAISRLDFET